MSEGLTGRADGPAGHRHGRADARRERGHDGRPDRHAADQAVDARRRVDRSRLRRPHDHRPQAAVGAGRLRRGPEPRGREALRRSPTRASSPTPRGSTATPGTSSPTRVRRFRGGRSSSTGRAPRSSRAARRSLKVELALIGGVDADRPRAAGLDPRARPRRGARQREQAPGGGCATSTSTRSPRRCSAACSPERAGRSKAIDFAARYKAGGTGLEIGGDWYDVVHRSDGIVHLTVGDVAGRGVARGGADGAAAQRVPRLRLRPRLARRDRGAAPPAHRAATRWRRRSASRSIRIRGELAYASAGHPPPMVRDDDTGVVVACSTRPGARRSAHSFHPRGRAGGAIALPSQGATLVLYTDGLIERRGQASTTASSD